MIPSFENLLKTDANLKNFGFLRLKSLKEKPHNLPENYCIKKLPQNKFSNFKTHTIRKISVISQSYKYFRTYLVLIWAYIKFVFISNIHAVEFGDTWRQNFSAVTLLSVFTYSKCQKLHF